MQSKLTKLILALHEKSSVREVSWEGTIYTGQYQSAFSQGVIRIDRDEREDVSLSIYNAEGRFVMGIASGDLLDTDYELAKKLEDIYQMADESVHRRDATLDSILNELGVSAHP